MLTLSILFPEILSIILALVLLAVICIMPHKACKNTISIVSYLLIAGGIFSIFLAMTSDKKIYIFDNIYNIEQLALAIKGLMLIGSGMIISYSKTYLMAHGLFKLEFFVLFLLSLLGQMICISSTHMLLTYLGIELMALAIYGLVAFNYNKEQSIEAGIKYIILGAIASGFLLYGISMIYGATSALSYDGIYEAFKQNMYNPILVAFGVIFILGALLFKLGLVPFHSWAPDVYEGGNTASTIIISTLPKIAVFFVTYRLILQIFPNLMVNYVLILQIVAIASLFVSNLTAIMQNNIKRLLAYSTISHIAFVLLAMISGYAPLQNSFNYAQAGFLYIIIYAFSSMAVFAILLGLSHTKDDLTFDHLKGLAKKYPLIGFGFLITIFSLAGIPPTIGFYAKLLVIESLMRSEMNILAILAILSSVIGAYYYLKIIKVIYFDDVSEQLPIFIQGNSAKIFMFINIALILILGIYPKVLVDTFNYLI